MQCKESRFSLTKISIKSVEKETRSNKNNFSQNFDILTRSIKNNRDILDDFSSSNLNNTYKYQISSSSLKLTESTPSHKYI